MIAFPEATRNIQDRQSRLIAEAVEGNAEAVSTLLRSARPIVYQWAAQRTQDPDDAEDVAQLVLIRLYSKLSAFRGESRLSSWLYRVTINESSGFCRKRAKEKARALHLRRTGFQDLTPNSDLDRIDRERAGGAVRDAACALPPVQAAAFRLVDLEGMEPCEAARELGKTQINIRSSLCRARKKVRELVRQARGELLEDLFPGGSPESRLFT